MTSTAERQPEPAVREAAAQPETLEAKEVEGRIKSLDPSAKSVTLEDGTTLAIPDSLKAARGVLKKGAMVKATYQEKDGQKVLTSIKVWLELEEKPIS
jgi:Cu/Ag efflux protein CusF